MFRNAKYRSFPNPGGSPLEDKLDDYELFLDELNDIIAERDSCKEFLTNTEEALERIEDIEIDLGNCKERAKTDADLASLYYHVLAQLDFPEINDLRIQVMAKVTKSHFIKNMSVKSNNYIV